jgi:hypothetical protein
MPRIKMTSGEFGDYVACFLNDKFTNPDAVIPPSINAEFDGLAEIMNRKGMRGIVLSYFMHVDPQFRVKYRLTRDVFRPKKKQPVTVLIEIVWEPEPKPEDPSFMTRMIRKAGRILKKWIAGDFGDKI